MSRATLALNLEMQVHSAPATDPASGESPLHEPDALSVRGVGWFVIFFVIATLLVLLIVWWMYVGFVRSDVASDAVNSALAGAPRSVPGPVLQPSPGHDNTPSEEMIALRKREDDEFVRRGWMDRDTEAFEIPKDIAEKVQQISARAGGGK